MRPGWLWDKNLSIEEIRGILRDPQHERFVHTAALLLSRNNVPKDIFDQYLDRKIFVHNWVRIKGQMRKNSWNDSRIVFWQAVYEKIFEGFKEKGIPTRPAKKEKPTNQRCKDIGEKIRADRQEMGLTQKELAQRLGISQQIISRIEMGRDNMSLTTLDKIFSVLGERPVIDFRPSWIQSKIYHG